MKNKFILAFLTTCLLALSACRTTPAQPPLLPPGLEEATVPDLSLGGFAYFNQGQPLVLLGNSPDLSTDISLINGGAALCTSGTIVGWSVLSSPEAAEGIAALLPSIAGISKTAQGAWLILSQGPEGSAIAEGKWVKFRDKESDVVKLLSPLPSRPPAAPVAVGLAWVMPPLLAALEGSQTVEGLQLAKLLDKARVEYVIGGVYAEKPLSMPVPPTISGTATMGASFLLIAKSFYYLPSVAWMSSARDIGFTRIQYSGRDILHMNWRGWNIVMGAKEYYIYVAAAPTLQDSVALFVSAIDK